MARHGTRSMIRPGVELSRIVIELHRHNPPVITLEGAVRSANRRADGAPATIRTGYLGEGGLRFVDEMKAAFGGESTTNAEN